MFLIRYKNDTNVFVDVFVDPSGRVIFSTEIAIRPVRGLNAPNNLMRFVEGVLNSLYKQAKKDNTDFLGISQLYKHIQYITLSADGEDEIVLIGLRQIYRDDKLNNVLTGSAASFMLAFQNAYENFMALRADFVDKLQAFLHDLSRSFIRAANIPDGIWNIGHSFVVVRGRQQLLFPNVSTLTTTASYFISCVGDLSHDVLVDLSNYLIKHETRIIPKNLSDKIFMHNILEDDGRVLHLHIRIMYPYIARTPAQLMRNLERFVSRVDPVRSLTKIEQALISSINEFATSHFRHALVNDYINIVVTP